MEEPHSQVGWYSQRRVTEHPRPLFPGFRGPAQGVGAQAPPAPAPAWCRLVLAVGPAALHLQRPREHQPGAWGRPGDRVCVAVSRGIAVQFSPASRPRARSVKGLPGPFHHLHPTAPLAPGTRKRTGPHFRGHQPDGAKCPPDKFLYAASLLRMIGARGRTRMLRAHINCQPLHGSLTACRDPPMSLLHPSLSRRGKGGEGKGSRGAQPPPKAAGPC